MQTTDLYKYIDHTLLKPTATQSEISKICEEALEFHTASACIPPVFVYDMHQKYPKLNICTVIGFPLGYMAPETKIWETKIALTDGANEIDMVININWLKDKKWDLILEEINHIKQAAGDKILKVIVETAYLEDEELIQITKIVSDSKADFIKTSTGFASRGANFHDIKIMKEYKRESLQIKAAGGIKSVDDMLEYIKLGATRLGTSSGIKLIQESIDS